MTLVFDHQFGLHAVNVGAFVLHHTVVAVLQRTVLQRRDDGVRVDAGSDRDLAHCLDPGLPGDMPLMLLKARRSLSSFRASPALASMSAVAEALLRGRVTSPVNRPTS